MKRDLTDRVKKYAIYLPSLQQPYAAFALKSNLDVRIGNLPSNFRIRDLDFMSERSKLWSCKFALYSSGQFTNSPVTNKDMILSRQRNGTLVVGDSGGYQLATGKITNANEKKELFRFATPKTTSDLYHHWFHTGFRERTLSWLDIYTDYAMTLDLPLWLKSDKSKSPFRYLSVDDLIKLSVDNLRYFQANRARAFGAFGTKFLNVLQDIGDGTGELWYHAVKDFDFEGWSFGGETKKLKNFFRRVLLMLEEDRFKNTELIHILAESPPKSALIWTAIQRGLSKAVGKDIQFTYDSSSPHRASGQNRAIYQLPQLSSKINSWRMSSTKIPQNYQVAQNNIVIKFPEFSPLSKMFTLNDLVAYDQQYRLGRVDSLSEHLMTNHNIYTFQIAALQACDLAFGDKPDFSRIPDPLLQFIEFTENFFEGKNPGAVLESNLDLLELVD